MLDFVGLGLTTVDVLLRLSQMPTWEQGSALQDLCIDGGGMVGTAMVAAARLGARAGYIGTCGNDEIAALKLQYLTRYGVDASHVIARTQPESQVVIVHIQSETGERVFTTKPDPASWLKAEELDRSYITSASFLLLDGFHYEAALQAARWMQAAGKTVVLDAGKTSGPIDVHMATLVQICDVLICGSGFGPTLSGIADLQEAGNALLELGPDLVVQTEGEGGCFTTTRGEHFHTPAYPVNVVDTTGAGDVFHGAYLYGMLQGWDNQRVACFASAAAALKCAHIGGRVGIPALKEVEALLAQQS